MSSRYDSRTTTFSPEGRLYQVEYAVEGITKAPTAVGIVTTEGVVFATERRLKHSLLDAEKPQLADISGEKVYKIDTHMAAAVAGITADANVLIDKARLSAQRHKYTYQEPMPAEDLCQLLCDVKHSYTQYGGVRPFGVAFLLGAFDRYHGFQLYHTDPSGNYSAWKAMAIGKADAQAQGLLKQEWKETMSMDDGIQLGLKVLGKTMDALNLTPDRLELAVLRKNAALGGANTEFHILTDAELKPMLETAEATRKKEEADRESKQSAQ
jgi:20S proteasome subunit alpha 3